jgi:mRNA degradation ribonuclease J1/J2
VTRTFVRAHESTWQLGIGADFSAWASGLSGWFDVTRGTGAINPATGAGLADEIEYDVVRERKKLAYGGAISLVVMVDKQNHTLAGDPHITFQGVANIDPLNGFAAEARNAVSEAIREMKPAQIADRNVFKENLRIHLKRYIQKELSSKPVIVTTIVEV